MKLDTDYESVKESIIAASKEVFIRHGYAKVSMDDISKASGKGRSTLYHYFKNKKEVFEAFATAEFSQLIHVAKSKIKSEYTFNENLFAYNKAKLAELKSLLQQYKNILDDIREQPDSMCRMNKLMVEEESEVIKGMLLWGIGKGEVAQMSAADLDFLTNVMVIAFRSFEQEIVMYEGLAELENKLQWLVNILCKGLKK